MDSPPPPLPPSHQSNKRLWAILAAVAVVALIGLLALMALGFFSFRFIRNRQAAVREATSQLEKTATEERAKMADQIRSGEVNGSDASLGRIKDQLEQSATKLSGSDAAAARAMASFMGKMQQQVRDYQAAATRFTQAQVFTPAYREFGGLEAQRQIVREFIEQNERLADTVRRSDQLLREEMDAVKVPPKARDSALAGFNKSQAAIRPVQARIRECDRTLADAALVALDLFERHWGRWRRDEATGKMLFADTATLVAYNALIERVQTAAADQAKAQEELVKVMSAVQKR